MINKKTPDPKNFFKNNSIDNAFVILAVNNVQKLEYQLI